MADYDTTINTSGGSSTGNVQPGRDFIGRDQINFFGLPGSWEEVCALLFKGQKRTVAIKAIQEQFQNFDWTKAEQAYLDKVIRLYDRVRILHHSVDVPLGDIFTQVYILNKPTARQRYNIDELRKQGLDWVDFQHQFEQRTQGLELVKTNKNLFILGKPGAGKTTFLKYITIQAARKKLPRIPIFVSLNEWADSKWGKGATAALLPFIIEQFAICDFPDSELFINHLLKEGRALVLFDGLDEVKQEKNQRRHLTHLLQAFARKYDNSQYLITCRIAASDYVFAGFSDVEVADFTHEQVREYARRWFGKNKKKFDAFTIDLVKTENKGLAELCKIPLLLSLLCLTFDNSMRFPLSRAELYKEALHYLLIQWDSSREIQRDDIYHALSRTRKLQLFISIASPAFFKGELFFHQRDLEKLIVEYLAKLPGAPPADMLDGTVILKAIEAQHSILVERAQGIYSFSHLTFQEYFTACDLIENPDNQLIGRIIHNHLTDQRWREVFLLTASLLADANRFITTMRRAIDDLVVTTPTIINVLDWVSERTKQANAPFERQVAVRMAYLFLDRSRIYRIEPTPTLALARPLMLALAQSLDHVLEITLASAFSRTLTVKRSRAVARETTLLVGFDFSLYYAWAYSAIFGSQLIYQKVQIWQEAMHQLPNLVNGVANLAAEAGLTNLAQQVVEYAIPSSTAGVQDWQQYADMLFAILRDERDLGREWKFSDEENDKFNHYFYANELLLQCLKVAVVSDRKTVLQDLLISPEAGSRDG